MVTPLKSFACTALLQVPNACMSGCFNQTSISQVTERARYWCLSSLALQFKRSRPLAMTSFSSSGSGNREAISVGFSLSFPLFGLMHRWDMVEAREESVSFVLQLWTQDYNFLATAKRRGRLKYWLLYYNLCRDLSRCLACATPESLESWSVRAVREEWDGKVREMKTEGGRERTRQRGKDREGAKREGKVLLLCSRDSRWNWFSYLQRSPTVPFLPLRPASITYLSRGWMIYTLPMSTADRYTHQRLPALGGVHRHAEETEVGDGTAEKMAKDGWRGREAIKAGDRDEHGGRESREPAKVRRVKRSVWLGRQMEMWRWRQSQAKGIIEAMS